MKSRFLHFLMVFVVLIIFSCKKENNPPVVDNQSFSVPENSPVGTIMGSVSASDPDGDLFSFKILAEYNDFPFKIDETTGELSVKIDELLNFESKAKYEFVVQVFENSKISYSASATITVNISNVDEAPTLGDQRFEAPENSPDGAILGSISVSNPDNDKLSYSILAVDNNFPFKINTSTGELSVQNGALLDYETRNKYEFVVQVLDTSNDSNKAAAAITVNVTNVDELPIISCQSFEVPENSPNGTMVGNIHASDPDNDKLSYKILSEDSDLPFILNENTGELSVKNGSLLDYETNDKYKFQVQVFESSRVTFIASATITVNLTDVEIHKSETFQPSANGIDAFIYDLMPDRNMGIHPDFMAGSWTNGGTPVIVKSLMKFDFSSIPESAKVESVRLSLYSYNSSQNGSHSTLNGSNSCVLQKINSDWDENSITWNNQPSTSTENQVILPQSQHDIQDYIDIDVTELVKGMVKNQSSNYGFMIKIRDEEGYRKMVFASSDNNDPDLHPKLVIYYTVEK